MVNFQPSELNVKDEIINNDTSMGQREKVESLTGIELMHDLPNILAVCKMHVT